jgi:hypothetical protein
MNKATLVTKLIILSLNALVLPHAVLAQGKIESDYLQEEFKILRTTLEELHPDLYRYTSQTEFSSNADRIANSLKYDLSTIEFYQRISPMVTQIKNGHTAIRLPRVLCDSLQVLPLRLISFKEKVYIHKDLSRDHSNLVGAEVKSINGISVDEIVHTSLKYVSVDGFNDNARFKAVVEDDLSLYYGLVWGGRPQFQIDITYPASNQPSREILRGISYDEFLSRYDQGEEFPWSLTRIDSLKAALLTVRSFNQAAYNGQEKKYFHHVIDDFFHQIQDLNLDHLILDIRFNGGGELKNSILLYSYLNSTSFQFAKQIEMASIAPPTYVRLTNYKNALKLAPIDRDRARRLSERVFYIEGHFSQENVHPKKNNFRGKLIVLVNGNTASAAGALASCIKNDNRGLIVGEENRDNYTGFSAGVPVILTLPHSGITVSIPIRKFTYASGEDTGRGAVPHYWVPSTADDFFNHSDAVLEFALGLLKH